MSPTGPSPPRAAALRGADRRARHAVVVVGAGPVGLSLAIDLAQRGQRVVLLDRNPSLASDADRALVLARQSSRAICFAKRTLEIFDRLGVGNAMVDHGVRWQRGKVFFGNAPVYTFDLLPEDGHERPAFVNLPQSFVEARLVERASELPLIDLRWGHRVSAVERQPGGVRIEVDTPEGMRALQTDWLVACDGSRSAVRAAIGEEASGRVFRDRFLIVDVKMRAGDVFPGGVAERWFWFDPPFHRGQSVLLHRQPDDIWRIDFQLGWDADPEAEKAPERIAARVRALLRHGLGRDVDFSLVWASVYTFACQRMARFRHQRIVFAGDAAHGVSPFGARGANSGVQDADNLGWKLAAVLRGQAPESLIDSYCVEREAAADENILHSTRSTDFITPKSEVSRLFRDAVLDLAREHDFARRLVNSGRLSTPTVLRDSPLNTPDVDAFEGAMHPGAPTADAPLQMGRQGEHEGHGDEGGHDGPGVRASWLLREAAPGFTLLFAGEAPAWAATLRLEVLALPRTADAQGWLARRYDLRPGNAYLLRPDQHVCARWRLPTAAGVRAALERAQGR